MSFHDGQISACNGIARIECHCAKDKFLGEDEEYRFQDV